MPVRMNIDGNRIKYKIDRTIKNGMGMLASQILKDCNLYCKEDTGTLIISSYTYANAASGIFKACCARFFCESF